jgi:hypothetical protein
VYSKKYKSIEYIEMRCKKSNSMIKKQQVIEKINCDENSKEFIESDRNCKEFIESDRNCKEFIESD